MYLDLAPKTLEDGPALFLVARIQPGQDIKEWDGHARLLI
jgi:hypothetical protein